jgi:hypothetical protein
VRGARDARIIIADRPFAAPAQFVIGEHRVGRHNAEEIAFDLLLVLRGRRDDRRADDPFLGIEVKTVKAQSTRRLGRANPRPARGSRAMNGGSRSA